MISIIVAVANDGVIGGGNQLLWHISEDLRRFKAITSNHPVIMGRKTFESLGRPLPNRINVVISRNASLIIEGCTVVGSLEQAVAMFPPREEVFIIGGGEIYRAAMPLADKLYITFVEHSYEGDTYFPDIDHTMWRCIHEEYRPHGEKFPHPFVYRDFVKAK